MVFSESAPRWDRHERVTYSDLLAAWVVDRAPKDRRLVKTPLSLNVSLQDGSASP
jgi:hypothetical protein